MPDIFLSYSREDDATARRVAEGLGREGFTVWWDRALRSGDTYDEVTERALREARAVVVLWSRHSVHSRWVRSEATIADRNGTLVPVMIETCDRPVMFELMQSADLARWKGDLSDPRWRAFISDLRGHLDQGAVPVQSPQPTSSRFRLSGLRAGILVALLALAGLATWWLLQRYSLIPGEGRPISIAVLPFEDLTPGATETALAEGLSEEISNWLAHVPDLRVVARTSAFMFKGGGYDVREVGRKLDARYILEGSVRRGENVVRVTTQLVTSKDRFHLWSRTFDLSDMDALGIEDAVSRAVAETLNARLSDQTERNWKARRSNAAGAGQLYLQGRYEQRLRTAESNLRAMQLYRQVIVEDPKFPVAYVSLAEATLNSASINGRDLTAAITEAGSLLDQALLLSPDMPEAIAAKGMLALVQYRTDEAMNFMQRALAANPSDADTRRRMGNLYEQLAQPRQAVAQYDLAAQVDPLDFMTQVYRCLSLQDLAQYALAEAACARAHQLNAANVWVPLATSWLDVGRGDLAAALQWINRAGEIAPEDVRVEDQRIMILRALQRYDVARKSVAESKVRDELGRSFQRAIIALEQQDQAELRRNLGDIARSGMLSADDWLTLAELQLAAGEAASAAASVDHARRSGGFIEAGLVNASQVRNGYSGALIVASVELAAGNRDAGLQLLKQLDDMLDRMEMDGAACSGLYSLRAASLALRGDPEAAMTELRRAHAKGWRLSQAARNEPALRSLQQRQDFKALMAQIDRQVGSIKIDLDSLPP